MLFILDKIAKLKDVTNSPVKRTNTHVTQQDVEKAINGCYKIGKIRSTICMTKENSR